MKSKRIMIITIITILSLSLIPQTNATEYKEMGIFDNIRIFNFNTTMDISTGETPDIVELNKTQEIPITIKFNYEKPRFFPNFLIETKIGNWVIFRDSNFNESLNITLELLESPEKCTAYLKDKTVNVTPSIDSKEVTTSIIFTYQKDAVAFKKGIFSIKAAFEPKEKWGLTPIEATTSFEVMPSYNGTIDFTVEDMKNKTKIVNTKPGTNITIPINITNTGNHENKVTIKINEKPENWNVTFIPITLDIPIGETKQTKINITVPKKEDTYTQKLNFTITTSANTDMDIDETYLKGETETFSVELNVEKEEEKQDYSNLLLILGVLIIVLLVIAVLIKIFKKKF